MKQRLRVERIDTVGFVDKGDNPPAQLVFFKRAAPTEKGDAKTFSEMRGSRRARDEVWQMTSDFADVVNRALDDDDVTDKAAFILQSLNEFDAAIGAALPNWTSGKPMEKQDQNEAKGLLTKLAQALGLKPEDAPAITTEKEAPVAEKPTEKQEPEAVSKAAVEALEKKLTEATERLEKAEADAKANAEKVEKLAEEKRVSTYIAKAETFKALPIKAAEFGPIMAKLAKALDEKEYAEVERVLAGANEAYRTSKLTQEIGSGAPEGSALAKLQAAVAEIQKANPTISEQEARGRAFKDNPALRRELDAEQAAR